MDVFREKLNELVKNGAITAQEAEIPDYGPLPEFEDSPPPDEDEEDEEEDEEEEESSEEDDDDSDEGGRRRRRRRGRGKKDDDDTYMKRQRPPKVFTPLEGRANELLKGLRKYKNESGQVAINNFERLPDKTERPEYYAAIRNPISLDLIKKKLKRKKYTNIDQVLQDLELMFENAKAYNKEGSEIHTDAIELQKQARMLTAQEKARPDDDFRDEAGRLPLDFIDYQGERWRVGKS